MKRLFLIAGVIFAGLSLSGCAKSNPGAAYHSYSYYTKHRKQAKATYEACEKIPAGVWHSPRFELSKKPENCFNAGNALGNKRYANARGQR